MNERQQNIDALHALKSILEAFRESQDQEKIKVIEDKIMKIVSQL